MQGKQGGASGSENPFAAQNRKRAPKPNAFLPENQPDERRNYAVRATKNPKAHPQQDLQTLGFVGASQVQQARQRYQANVRAQHEPRVEQAGKITPKPIPKGFTGLTPTQERQAARVGATKPRTPGLNTAAKVIRATPPTALALTAPLARYVADVPKEIATQKRTKRQQEAGIFYTDLLKGIPQQLGHDVTHPGVNLALDALLFGTGAVQLGARGAMAARAAKAANELSYVDQANAAAQALRTRVLPQEILPRALVGEPNTGTRSVRIEQGTFQPLHQSPSIPVAAAQHAFDRLSERIPHVPVVGAIPRATRILPEAQMLAQRRATAELIPLQRESRRLRKRGGGVSLQQAAVSAVSSFGHGPKGVKLLDTDIARRERRIFQLQDTPAGLPGLIRRAELANKPARAERLRNELAVQQARVEIWKAARPYVENPANTEALQNVLNLASERSGITQAGRVERGLVEPATAEAAVARHARIASGATFVTEQEAAAQVRTLGRSLRQIAVRKRQVKREIKRAFAPSTTAGAVSQGQAASRAADLASGRRAKLADELRGLAQTERELGRVQAKLQRLSSGKNLSSGDLAGLRPGMDFSKARIRELGKTYDQSIRLQRRLDRQFAARQLSAEEAARAPVIVQAQTTAEKALAAARQAQLEAAKRGENTLSSLSEAERKVAARRDQIQPGLTGAEGVTPGPGAFFQPDVENARTPVSIRVRSINRPAPEKIHQSRGVLFGEGRNRLGPQVTIDDALKDIRFKEWQRQAREAESFSRPFDPETFDPKKDVLLNPQGAKVPRYLTAEKQALRLDNATVGEVAQDWLDARTSWRDEVFPSSVANVPEEHRLGLRVIDKKLAKGIIGIERFNVLADRSILVRVLDFSNNVNRAALIYLNPSYIPKNFAGNLAFLHLQQLSPFLVGSNLRRASVRMSDLSPVTLDTIVTEAGGGAARELAHEATGALSKPLTHIADFQGAGADRLPRIAAWLYEADRRGFKTAQQIEQLLHEQQLLPLLNEVSDAAQQAMVKFGRAPLRWRRIAGKAIFIFPWIEGATRYVPRLVLDRPLSARIASGVRDRLEEYQKQVFGDAKNVVPGRIPYGHPFSKYGTQVVKTINTTSLSPVGQASSVVNATRNAISGDYTAPDQLSAFIQPTATALVEALSGVDLYNRRAYPAGQGFGNILSQELLGTAQRPGIPLAAAVATALRSQPQTAGRTTLVPQSGIVAALQQLLYGSAKPGVLVNLPAAAANARRRKGIASGGGGTKNPFEGRSSGGSRNEFLPATTGTSSNPFAG